MRDQAAELAQLPCIVAFDLSHVMDVRAVDQLALPLGQVVEPCPEVGAEGVRAVGAFQRAVEQLIVAVVLIEAADGELAVLDLEPLALVLLARHGAGLFERVGKRAAVPQQLDIFVLRMADGELAEERRVLAQCRAGQQRHGDRAVHIAFAGDDVAHVSQNAVGGAGHGSDAQLHGGPALGGNDVDVVFLEELFIKKHECVDLLRERRGILVHLIALEQDLRALLQLCIALFEDAVIFIDNDRHIDRNDVHTEALHQFALVENNGAEGLRPQTDLRDAHTAEILDHTGYADEFVQAVGENRVAYGYDNLPAEALTMYADGWITGVGTLFPAETVHVYDLCKAGKPLEARDYIMTVCRKYMHFFNEPTQEGLPSPWLAIIKEGLTMRGIPIGLPRRPIHPLPDSVRAELTAVMRAFGYYKLG